MRSGCYKTQCKTLIFTLINGYFTEGMKYEILAFPCARCAPSNLVQIVFQSASFLKVRYKSMTQFALLKVLILLGKFLQLLV